MRSNLKSLGTITNLAADSIPMALNNTTFVYHYTFEIRGAGTGANHMRIFLRLYGNLQKSGALISGEVTVGED